jgi:hypothetical protein
MEIYWQLYTWRTSVKYIFTNIFSQKCPLYPGRFDILKIETEIQVAQAFTLAPFLLAGEMTEPACSRNQGTGCSQAQAGAATGRVKSAVAGTFRLGFLVLDRLAYIS